jgi:tetratricopeptide (TPR) repeat protein
MKRFLAFLKQVYYTIGTAARRAQVQLQPRQAGTHHDLGKVLVAQGQWQSAVAACQKAIELDPNCVWFYKTLSEAYLGQGLWQQAITASQTGISLSPNSSKTAWLHHTLAKAYLGQEQWQSAIVACQQALKLDSQSWFYASLGEALLKSGQWAAAVAPLRQAIQLDPHFPWTYYYLGEALLAQEKISEAIQIYQQVVQNHPEVDYLKYCLDYAQHLQTQEQRIQDYCQQAQQTQQPPDRLRILMVTPYPTYPPKLGAITRMFHEMQTLGSRHELVVVSFIFMKDDYRLETELAHYCDFGLTVMIGDAPPRQPDQPKLIHRYSSERMRKLLRLLQPVNFDVFLCDFIYMAQYRDLFPDAYAVLAEHNIESQLLQRCAAVNQNSTQLEQLAQQTAAVKAFVASDTEAERLAVYEDEYWKKFNLRMVVSHQDKHQMDDRCRVGRTLVVNNGIDTQNIKTITNPCNQKILFIGTMSYYPNIDGACYFVEQILPIVWQHQAHVTFCIAGAEPPQAILDLTQDSRVTVVANPENMSDVAATCQITVVPLRIGGGTRIKILHSMAMGLPVVSTSLGCEGLAVADGVHLLVRDQPEDFAAAILQLCSDLKLQQTLRQNGRTLVEQTYDWQRIFQAAEQEIVADYRRWKRQDSVA